MRHVFHFIKRCLSWLAALWVMEGTLGQINEVWHGWVDVARSVTPYRFLQLIIAMPITATTAIAALAVGAWLMAESPRHTGSTDSSF